MNCHQCVHKGNIPGDAHVKCNNFDAKVVLDPHGVKNGWAVYPINFDPVWIKECNGFSTNEEDKQKHSAGDELIRLVQTLKFLGG